MSERKSKLNKQINEITREQLDLHIKEEDAKILKDMYEIMTKQQEIIISMQEEINTNRDSIGKITNIVGRLTAKIELLIAKAGQFEKIMNLLSGSPITNEERQRETDERKAMADNIFAKYSKENSRSDDEIINELKTENVDTESVKEGE